ncbi:MAG: radical SAM protein [Promethearchaeota archaeon]
MAVDSNKRKAYENPGKGSRVNVELRALRQEGFSIEDTSTAGFSFPWRNPCEGGRSYMVYGNLNFSIYSAETCNANCPFCVEKLRPLSRGVTLESQKKGIEDERYFKSMRRAFEIVRPLNPSISITGGEPSIDPRLPGIIELIDEFNFRKRTITTNGSGLVDGDYIDLLAAGGFSHVNVSRAHHDEFQNASLMGLHETFSNRDLEGVVERVNRSRMRPRLSCVLLKDGIRDLQSVIDYLEWSATTMNVDNVVFRQVMKFDRKDFKDHDVTRYCMSELVDIHSILKQVQGNDGTHHESFAFTKQVVGYYYYIEVYQYKAKNGRVIDVVFEDADLSFIGKDRRKHGTTPRINELIFHPDGSVCSTWQPWDGIIVKGPGYNASSQ